MSEKDKKVCRRTLNYFKHFIVFASSFRGCALMSAFASLVDVSVVGFPGVSTSSSVGLKICPITAGIKNYKSIITGKLNRGKSIIK